MLIDNCISIIRCLLLKYYLIFLKVLDQPSSEPNTERRVKILAQISKRKAPNVKFHSLGTHLIEFVTLYPFICRRINYCTNIVVILFDIL